MSKIKAIVCKIKPAKSVLSKFDPETTKLKDSLSENIKIRNEELTLENISQKQESLVFKSNVIDGGLTSNSAAVRNSVNDLFSHGRLIKTPEMFNENGLTNKVKFWEQEGINFSMDAESLYYDYIGIDSESSFKFLKSKMKEFQGQVPTKAQFFDATARSIVTGIKHESKEVNQLAKQFSGFTNRFLEYGVENGLNMPLGMTPANAAGYFTLSVDKVKIVKDPKGYRQTLSNEFIENNNLLHHNAPVIEKYKEKTTYESNLIDGMKRKKKFLKQEKVQATNKINNYVKYVNSLIQTSRKFRNVKSNIKFSDEVKLTLTNLLSILDQNKTQMNSLVNTQKSIKSQIKQANEFINISRDKSREKISETLKGKLSKKAIKRFYEKQKIAPAEKAIADLKAKLNDIEESIATLEAFNSQVKKDADFIKSFENKRVEESAAPIVKYIKDNIAKRKEYKAEIKRLRKLKKFIKEQAEDAKKLTEESKAKILDLTKLLEEEITNNSKDFPNGVKRIPLIQKGKNDKGVIEFYEAVPKDKMLSKAAQIAQEVYEKQLGMTPDEVEEVMNQIKFGGAIDKPNQLMARGLKVLQENIMDYTINDMPYIANSYARNMGKYIEIEAFKKKNGIKPQQGLSSYYLNMLAEERKLDEEVLIKRAEDEGWSNEKLQEQLGIMQKNFLDNQQFVKDMTDYFEGKLKSNTPRADRLFRALQAWNVVTALGGAAAIGLTDIGAAMFHTKGLSSLINYGVKPLLTNPAFRNQSKSSARRLGIGIQGFLRDAENYARTGKEAFADMSMLGKVADGMEFLASYNGLVNLTDPIQGFFGRIGTNMIEGEMIDMLSKIYARADNPLSFKFNADDIASFHKISAEDFNMLPKTARHELISDYIKTNKQVTFDKNELEMFKRMQIDPYSPSTISMIEQISKHGEIVDDVLITNYEKWTDTKARQQYFNAITNIYESTFMSGRKGETPLLFAKSPAIGSFFQFLSWSIRATNNFLIPALQNPNSGKLQATLMMMAVGSLVKPIREIAAGEEVDLSFESMVNEGILNSGVLGIYGDVWSRTNALFGIYNEGNISRFRNKSIGDLFGGALFGNTQAVINTLVAMKDSNMSKTTVKRFLKTIPFLNTLYFRKVVNDAVDAAGYV